MIKVMGNGLMANKFKGVDLPSECMVLASGVSNSKEVREERFKREVQLVYDSLLEYPKKTAVYFSTCSINQQSISPYIRHKIYVEELIKDCAVSYYIFRLPQVVGLANNMTLVNYFTYSILNRRQVEIQKYATRNLLDVDDVVRIVQYLINNSIGNNTIQNIAAARSVSVLDIFRAIEEILSVRSNPKMIESGVGYDISIEFIKKSIGINDKLFLPDYWANVLAKYVPLLVHQSQAK